MKELRFPAPLQPGDRIGVTAPSAGVQADLRPRLDVAVKWLEARGYEVVVGECMDGASVTSGSPIRRAQELTRMLTDPRIRAVIPPWGGELAIEILPHLDFDAIGSAEPTWLIGYSDISTLLLPLTLLTGVATLHGQNLMDTPNRIPDEIRHWSDAISTSPGGRLTQRASLHHARQEAQHAFFRKLRTDPTATDLPLEEPGSWRLGRTPSSNLDVQARLIGGCIEVLAPLAGSRYGDVWQFGGEHAKDGLIIYLEACESPALDIARSLWSMRLAGWFEHAVAVLIGRTQAPPSANFSQDDAVMSALGDLDIPLVLDVDCGHVPPHLCLINGAHAHIVIDEHTQRITQTIG